MKNSHQSGITIPEPTEKDIKETIENVKDKYNVTLDNDDAKQYARLSNEFTQWYLIEKESQSPDSPSKTDLTADASLSVVIQKEKERIANDMKAIIDKYK